MHPLQVRSEAKAVDPRRGLAAAGDESADVAETLSFLQAFG
jgi:hypothetical protein